jgi:hypothetical protein
MSVCLTSRFQKREPPKEGAPSFGRETAVKKFDGKAIGSTRVGLVLQLGHLSVMKESFSRQDEGKRIDCNHY